MDLGAIRLVRNGLDGLHARLMALAAAAAAAAGDSPPPPGSPGSPLVPLASSWTTPTDPRFEVEELLSSSDEDDASACSRVSAGRDAHSDLMGSACPVALPSAPPAVSEPFSRGPLVLLGGSPPASFGEMVTEDQLMLFGKCSFFGDFFGNMPDGPEGAEGPPWLGTPEVDLTAVRIDRLVARSHMEFMTGMQKLFGVASAEELVKYMYAGDDYSSRGKEYADHLVRTGAMRPPVRRDNCVCGVSIKFNAYMVDLHEDQPRSPIVIGRKCVHKFGLPRQACSRCGRGTPELCAACRSTPDGAQGTKPRRAGNSKLKCGAKHSGKTFKEILERDKTYCKWVLRLRKPTGLQLRFREYLESKRQLHTTPKGKK